MDAGSHGYRLPQSSVHARKALFLLLGKSWVRGGGIKQFALSYPCISPHSPLSSDKSLLSADTPLDNKSIGELSPELLSSSSVICPRTLEGTHPSLPSTLTYHRSIKHTERLTQYTDYDGIVVSEQSEPAHSLDYICIAIQKKRRVHSSGVRDCANNCTFPWLSLGFI